MDDIDITKLKYNPTIIKNKLKIVGEMVMAGDDLMVVFPEHFIKRELAILGSTVKLVSIYCIIDSSYNYAVIASPIFQELSPERITETSIAGKLYKVLKFSKDTLFLVSDYLVITDNFLYDVFDEFFIKGNVPFYIDYEKLSGLFLESKKYANSNIGTNSIIFEIISAIISRNSNDKTIYWRHSLNKGSKDNMEYIGLSNIYYAFDSTGAKIIGSYFEPGLVNAVMNKEKTPTETVKVLRY